MSRPVKKTLFGHPIPTSLLLAAAGMASLAAGGCASFPGSHRPALETEIKALIQTPPLDQLHWGILVVDAENGETLFSRNAHRKFVPASNMKLLATSTALSLLGPEYRFETELWGVGEMDGSSGRLEGDLILRPSGDPTLSEEFYPSATAPLDSLARGLWEAGVRSVSGALVVDASAWDSTTVPDSWMVGNLSGSSGATGAALAIAEGEVLIELSAGSEVGAPAAARWWPATPEGFFEADFITAPADSSLRREVHYFPESRRLRVEGRIPLGHTDTISVAQRDAAGVASGALLRAVEAQGIRVEGGLRMAWTEDEAPSLENTSGARRLSTLTSPPMAEIVEAILEPSQNWMTEQLVHVLGLELGEEGSWREGFAVEGEFLAQKVGVDTLDIHYRDGSGLSAYNLVTPRALVRVLKYMRDSPHGEIYRNALAEPGEEEGTLRRRLPGLEGRVFAKTGTISHVNSLSGYLVTDSGREIIFSVLTNASGLSSTPVRAAIDQVVQAVVRR